MSTIIKGVDKCAHGKFYGFDPSHREMAMAAPFYWCECCQQITFYIASSSSSFDMSTGESHGSSSKPADKLCPECGGKWAHEEW